MRVGVEAEHAGVDNAHACFEAVESCEHVDHVGGADDAEGNENKRVDDAEVGPADEWKNHGSFADLRDHEGNRCG